MVSTDFQKMVSFDIVKMVSFFYSENGFDRPFQKQTSGKTILADLL